MKNILLLVVLLVGLALGACSREEKFLTGGDVELTFSVDTLRFDTVFTELGSATRFFKIYNRYDQPVRLSRVFLPKGDASSFRLNVDGIPGNSVEEVEIRANDSLYVFSEVTVDPDQPLSVSPFVIEEEVLVEVNGNTQRVVLEAWGQNANYFPSRFNKGVPVVLTCGNNEIVWDDPKPYVIYGAIFIDSCTLVLPPGARLHVHGGIARNDLFGVYNDGIIYTLSEGKIRVQGTAEAPVTIQGDRLEEDFQEATGQWNGIIIGRGSRGNIIEHATIKNARFGILADSSSEVSLRSTQIYNTASSGIVGFSSTITAENTLVYNNGSTSVQLILGGDYRFTYCTLASYGVNASALAMSNFFCYDDPLNCQVREIRPLKARFLNSIIFGSLRDEIELIDIAAGAERGLFDVIFQNSVVKVQELLTERDNLYANFFEDICNPCINGESMSPLFVDSDDDDYHLDSLSIALEFARPIFFPRPIPNDLEGKRRDGEMPDAGCYERE